MKKKLIWIASIVGIIAVGTYITFSILTNVAEYDAANKEEETPIVETAAPPVEEKPEIGSKEEVAEQTGYIGGIEFDTKLTPESTESEVIDVMHKMTHQKVRSEDKWGAIPMSEDTINQVYEVVKNSDFATKQDLMSILEDWKKGIFTHADEDHNYFWKYQGGTIGEAYGTLSEAEEQEFIKNNFPNEVE